MNLLPQFGFFELMVVAVIALVAVGPKDLPRLMRTAGQLVGKARRMAGEFVSAFEQMARETEMDEMRREIETLKKDNVFAETKREIDEAVKPIDEAVRDEAHEVKDALDRPVDESEPDASGEAGEDVEGGGDSETVKDKKPAAS
ncbi:MAG: Sec-independent protein translocase protein TatB [Parvularculaceae bacterium]